MKESTIAVIGLGYVGLPLAYSFSKELSVIGFDIDTTRIQQLKLGNNSSQIFFTSNSKHLGDANVYFVAVPTDVDEHKVPNLIPLRGATKYIAENLKKGDTVIFESTVFPGCTEEVCVPILEEWSGLEYKRDFKVAYSPERISPGSDEHALTKITKVVSGCDEETVEFVAALYGTILEKQVYKAPSIKVAEAAKVVENTQRDLNISLMNELAIIFDRLEIDTKEVVKAASTKWNFHQYTPGLVGGHCISVDPFYLIHKSREVGYEPDVIAAGRRVNDGLTRFIAKKLVQTLIDSGKNPGDCHVLVMGVTYKENISDTRNSRAFDLITEIREFRIKVSVFDPNIGSSLKGIKLFRIANDVPTGGFDAAVVCVPHREFLVLDEYFFISIMKDEPVLMDVKGIYSFGSEDIKMWSL